MTQRVEQRGLAVIDVPITVTLGRARSVSVESSTTSEQAFLESEAGHALAVCPFPRRPNARVARHKADLPRPLHQHDASQRFECRTNRARCVPIRSFARHPWLVARRAPATRLELRERDRSNRGDSPRFDGVDVVRADEGRPVTRVSQAAFRGQLVIAENGPHRQARGRSDVEKGLFDVRRPIPPIPSRARRSSPWMGHVDHARPPPARRAASCQVVSGEAGRHHPAYRRLPGDLAESGKKITFIDTPATLRSLQCAPARQGHRTS